MKVLLADDHVLVRDTIAAFLRSEGIEEVHTASTLGEAVEVARSAGEFDLVLLDYNMPVMQGAQGIDMMKAAAKNCPVAILSGAANPSMAKDLISAGAAGFIPKTLSSKSIVSAVNFMAAGEVFVPFDFLNDAPNKSDSGLTDRELEVLRGVCRGASNKEIARELDLKEVTVKLHVKTLSRKLDAKNRTHAAMIAKENNLV